MRGEGAGGPVPSPADAVERILRALATHIHPLMGRAGFHMLLQRALRKAQDAHPGLGMVSAPAEGDPYLPELEDATRDAPPEEAAAAAEAVIAELLGLLTRFIGTDITLELIQQSFPLLSDRTVAGTEETHDD
jgi:hypothetical protein